MDKDSAKKMKTHHSPALRRGQESNSSSTQESAATAKDGRTKITKRKASPEKKTTRKRTRVSESEPQNTSEEDLRVRVLKKTVKEDGEGPSKKKKKKKRGLDLNQLDKELASSSADAGREMESAATAKDGRTKRTKRKASPEKKTTRKRTRVSESEPQNTSEEDLRVRVLKKTVKEDGEGPSMKKKKKKRRGLDLNQLDKELASSSADTGREMESAATAKDGRTKRTKRKASPEKKTTRKRTRVSESEPQNTSEEDLRVRVLKKTVKEDGEGPSMKKKKKKKKRRGLDLNQLDKELASSSADTGRESSSNASKGKRKATADGEGPSREKKRRQNLKETKKETKHLSKNARAQFEAKYVQQNQLGEGGCGYVFAGYRKEDHLQVAIKHVPKDKVFCKHADKNGKQLSVEVAVMLKLAAESTGSMATSAPVSLLDWYDLRQELILVMERPIPSQDLHNYIEVNGGSLQEEEAKLILKQLVDAAKELQNKDIFHRDIKVENILIETGSDVPRVRLIDFGLSCFVKKTSFYRIFYGTPAHVPPEWCNGRCTYRAGPTTVWQMGVVLYDTLHRKTLFDTTMFLECKLKISNNLSKDCRDFLQMCLAKVPEQRPTLEQLQLHPWLR